MANKQSYNYFDKFIVLVDYSCKASQMLYKIIENYNVKHMDEIIKSMHEIEHTADIEKHELINKLSREFITPIEREDIMILTEQIDDLTDFIEDVVMVLYMFNVSTLRKEAILFAEVICKCCDALKKIFEEFSNFKKSSTINDLIIAVNNLEEEADKIYVNSVRNLFTSTVEPIEIMKWRETFNRLEKCCDSCEVIANSIEGIIMKNS